MRPPAGRDPHQPTMKPTIPHHDRFVSIESLARDARSLPGIRKDALTQIVTLALDQLRDEKERLRTLGPAPSAAIQADRRNVEVDR